MSFVSLPDVMAVITVGNESGWQALFNYVHQLCPRVLNCDSCMLYLCTTEMEEIVTLSVGLPRQPPISKMVPLHTTTSDVF